MHTCILLHADVKSKPGTPASSPQACGGARLRFVISHILKGRGILGLWRNKVSGDGAPCLHLAVFELFKAMFLIVGNDSRSCRDVRSLLATVTAQDSDEGN